MDRRLGGSLVGLSDARSACFSGTDIHSTGDRFLLLNQSINQSINPVVLGDRIVAVDGAPVVSDEDFEAALAGAKETGGGVVRFTLRSAEAAPLSLGAWPRKLIPPFLH